MKNTINDIQHCLSDAKVLSNQFTHTQYRGGRVYQIFTSLAGDKTIGFLAYVIWKSRGRWLSSLSNN